MLRRRLLLVALACAALAAALAGPVSAAPSPSVPSLDPQATQAMWERLT